MLQKFGHNTILIDFIHGTNIYDFILITVIILLLLMSIGKEFLLHGCYPIEKTQWE